MISFFSTWAQGIIVALIITVLIEMILPEGNNKKYLKIILGLYVLYTVLNPILSKFSEGININDQINNDYYAIENTISVVAMNTNSSIETIYIDNIKREIKNYISTKGFDTTKIDITIETENEELYGIVKTVELSIAPKDEKNISEIEPVNIKSEEGERKEKYISIEDNIKEYLKNNYGADIENIIINS